MIHNQAVQPATTYEWILRFVPMDKAVVARNRLACQMTESSNFSGNRMWYHKTWSAFDVLDLNFEFCIVINLIFLQL